jgi:hypothetical protein
LIISISRLAHPKQEGRVCDKCIGLNFETQRSNLVKEERKVDKPEVSIKDEKRLNNK